MRDAVALSDQSAEQARLDEIVWLHEAPLLARARRLCGNNDDARDLVQDTFERAFRRIDNFSQGTHLRAWLMTILTNLFVDRVRHDKVLRFVELMPANHPAEPPPCPPELEVPRETILAAIARLDDDLREVIELHELEGLSYREIGSRIDIPPGTVGTRLVRARARLRVLLEAAVAEGPP